MKAQIYRKLFLGFIQIHILHHAGKRPFFGLWMIEELREHGYNISAGTLYPILHNLESMGLLFKEDRIVDGKVRKYYSLTDEGSEVLRDGRLKARELFYEIENEG